MAVMTSQYSEAVAFEQKTQPVPSSDKMALDLDINGSANRDDIHHDSNEAALIKTTPSPSDALVAESPEINGKNMDAFSSNSSIMTKPSEPRIESQSSPASTLIPSQLPETNSTIATQPSNSPSAELESSLLPSAEAAIESAIDDVAPTTAVPPVVAAPESDLRDTTQLATPETSADEDSHLLDISLEDEAVATRISEINVDPTSQATDLDHVLSPPVVPDSQSQPPEESNTTNDTSAPVQASTEEVKAEEPAHDTFMTDASPPPIKMSRDREDDDEVEPSAKRTKTEDGDSAALNDTPSHNGIGSAAYDGYAHINDYQNKEYIKIIKAVARSLNGKNFRLPVAKLWPNFAAAYAEKIGNEIDLETMEHRLRDNMYATLGALKSDIELLYQNALTFNGPDHTITNSALAVKNALLEKISAVASEPPRPVKKEKKGKRSTPVADAVPRGVARRRSGGAHGAVAPTPAAPTFALDPTSNTPLIRRDSTKIDGGRPKREIHPPKNKDLPYSVRPKSKKHASELKFCETVLAEIWKQKHSDFVAPFTQPVDPVALNIPGYFTIIKKPMDLSTMATRLREGTYTGAADFEKDMRQIIWNCFKFNPPGNHVNSLGKQFEQFFETQWAKKDQYLADRSPVATSPASDRESEDEEDEEESAVDPNSDALMVLKERLLDEQGKLIKLMSSNNASPSVLSMQQQMVAIIQQNIDDELKNKSKPKKAKAAKTKKSAVAKRPSIPKKNNTHRPNNKYMGTLEKETISAGLGALPDEVSNEVLADIKRERPNIDAGEDGTLELDIDVISVPLLWKIHGLIMKWAPDVQEEIRKTMQQDAPRPVPKAAPKKKNKPMSKQEQERSIDALSRGLSEYQRGASGSQEPVMPTVEPQDESSGDEDSDSEEE